MNVTGYALDAPANWTRPYPATWAGALLRLVRGDYLAPHLSDVRMRAGRETEAPNWFNCIPARVTRKVVGWRPFVALRLGRFGVYAGWKVYGVDSAAYLDYPGVKVTDVFDGSRALVGTLRFTRRLA